MATKTRGKKDRDATQNDGGVSYFQKTVCLHDWWLVKAEKDFEGKRLAVAGSTSRELQAVRLFTSAPIVKRYDVFTVETADGICVCINGFINRRRTTENGFSPEVFHHFHFGFPPYWEEYAKWPAKDSDPGLISTPIEHGQKVVSQDYPVHLSGVQNASKGPRAVGSAVNSSSKANVDEQGSIPVDALPAANTPNRGANLSTSVEVRINHSPSEVKADEGNARKKENKVNTSLYVIGKRTTRSHSQITKCAQKTSYEIGGFMMQKDRDSTMQHNVDEQGTIPVDASPAANTPNHVANLSISAEVRINHSSSEIKTDKGNVREKENKVNTSLNVSRKRKTRSHSQIKKCSQETSSEIGGSMMQKDRDSTMQHHDGQKLSRSIPRSPPSVISYINERCSPWREIRRKLDFEKASPLTRARKRNQTLSPVESLNLKSSRSGRVLLPPLEFWRNQIPVYDQTRKVTGIKDELDAVKQSGSRSEPQKRRKPLF